MKNWKTEKLNDYIKVINPSVIVILAALGLLLVGGLAWGLMGNIPQTEKLEGAFYSSGDSGVCDYVAAIVSAEIAARLEEGMAVQVSPQNADSETYGYAKGEVESISQYPASRDEVLALLKNDQLTSDVMGNASGLLVIIYMQQSDTSKSGIVWSGSRGNEVEIKPGTAAAAQVIIKNQRPIELILGD